MTDLSRSMPMPPTDIETKQCWCGAWYLDHELGHQAHAVVFGHTPGDSDEETDDR